MRRSRVGAIDLRGGARTARRARHAGRAGGARRPASRPTPAARQVPPPRPRAGPVVVNPMLTGPLPAGRSEGQGTVEDGGRAGFRTARGRPAKRRRQVDARRGLDADGRRRRSRSATATRPRWARSTCSRPGVERTVPGLEDGEQGPDADDPALTLDVWRQRIRRHPGELKNLLRNQAFVAGIGNAYSDEILHAARLLPFRKRSTLAAEEVDELYRATRRRPRARDRDSARARPANLRDAGPRLPRRPPQGRPGMPALRDPDHRGQARRIRDVLLPRLPALGRRRSQPWGIFSVCPMRRAVERPIPLSAWIALTVVLKRMARS